MRNKSLRSGYTTGACAAAAAKAATMILVRASRSMIIPLNSPLDKGEICFSPQEGTVVEIPLPDKSRVSFKVHNAKLIIGEDSISARASVIKDAGDDPDITNGAEIQAEVSVKRSPGMTEFLDEASSGRCEKISDSHLVGAALCGRPERKQVLRAGTESRPYKKPGFLHLLSAPEIILKGGKGVGVVTKPGLPVPVGQAAINPVPGMMIREAVLEAFHLERMGQEAKKANSDEILIRNPGNHVAHSPVFLVSLSEKGNSYSLQANEIIVTISVPEGENLAKRTLNPRLGIVGGISILGTTGMVKPVSTEAWTATIKASMDVAKAMGCETIVLSTGRTSEKAHMEKYRYPEESYVMMGDHLKFTLLEARKHRFKKVHLCAQWGKMLKIALATPQTHVNHGAIDLKRAVNFLKDFEYGSMIADREFNTAREMFDFINSPGFSNPLSIFYSVCTRAKEYAQGIAKELPVTAYLVSYEGLISASSE